jgi:uncharacterized membrane protein YfcA
VHIDGYLVLGAAVVGLLVGTTGAGGGALMTPMLIVLFGVKPIAAISSDLVASVVMRPIGAGVHMRARTVNFRLVKWMAIGSVPAAFAGTFLLHLLGNSHHAKKEVKLALGLALLIGAAAMGLRYLLDKRRGEMRTAGVHELQVRPTVTLAIGIVGGLIVGLTSVGSGSLMIVLLLFAYPMISARSLVGTDLTQAVPLTLAAAIGALLFGHVQFGVTASLIIGAVPGVLVGSLLSSKAPDRYIRPVIAIVICASGLKYVGLGNTDLIWGAAAAIVVAFALWLVGKKLAPAPVSPTPQQAELDRGSARAETPNAEHTAVSTSVT